MYAAGYDKRKILSGKLQQHGFLEKKNFLELERILVCSVVVHLPQNVFCRYYISADKHGVVFFGGIEYKVSSAWVLLEIVAKIILGRFGNWIYLKSLENRLAELQRQPVDKPDDEQRRIMSGVSGGAVALALGVWVALTMLIRFVANAF